jgi:hypothetical protein
MRACVKHAGVRASTWNTACTLCLRGVFLCLGVFCGFVLCVCQSRVFLSLSLSLGLGLGLRSVSVSVHAFPIFDRLHVILCFGRNFLKQKLRHQLALSLINTPYTYIHMQPNDEPSHSAG